eukprot:6183945-Pleurochrysis_carterae.AAC.5
METRCKFHPPARTTSSASDERPATIAVRLRVESIAARARPSRAAVHGYSCCVTSWECGAVGA